MDSGDPRVGLLRKHPIALAVPWLTTAVFAVLWWTDVYPAEPVWGSVAEWFAGVATAGGLVFAAQQIRHATDQRRGAEESERLSQSRAVAIASQVEAVGDRWKIWYQVSNATDRPVFRVVVLVLEPKVVAGADYMQNDAVLELYLGTIHARTEREGSELVHLSSAPSIGEGTRICALLFTDSWGQHWIRQDQRATRRAYEADLA